MPERVDACRVSMVAVAVALLLIVTYYTMVTHATHDYGCPICGVKSNSSVYLFVYGSSGCKACIPLKGFLSENYGNITIFCDLATNSSCRLRFFDLISNYEVPPEIPMTFVVSERGIIAIVVGDVQDKQFWDELIHSQPTSLTSIPIYGGSYRIIKYLNIENQTEFIMKYLPEVAHLANIKPVITPSLPLSGPELLATVVVLALLDSINPCCIYIYVTLLIAATTYSLRALASSRKVVLASGVPFIASVYAGYYLLGLGLTRVFAYVPLKIFGIVAIAFGIWVIMSSGSERVIGKERILKLVPKAKVSALISAILGFCVTYAILPCSAGPYVVFTGLISKVGLTSALTWLAIYNLIFVMPLVAVLAISLKLTEVSKVREFIIRYNKHVSIAMGAVLVALGVYVILT